MTVFFSLQGDIKKVRVAVCAGIAVPLVMFILWDAAILGNLGNPHLQVSMVLRWPITLSLIFNALHSLPTLHISGHDHSTASLTCPAQ